MNLRKQLDSTDPNHHYSHHFARPNRSLVSSRYRFPVHHDVSRFSMLASVSRIFVLIPALRHFANSPPQSVAMKKMFAFRRKAMVWTDKRARLIQELLGGMKVIKFFGKLNFSPFGTLSKRANPSRVHSLGGSLPQEASRLPSKGDEGSTKLAGLPSSNYRCRHVVSFTLPRPHPRKFRR
jgi:hypothetical protein